MCVNYKCSKRDKCYRYRAKPDLVSQIFTFPLEDTCIMYWPLTKDLPINNLPLIMLDKIHEHSRIEYFRDKYPDEKF